MWRVSPLYDSPSSQPYGDNTLALSIAGERGGNIPGTRFVALGETVGLPSRATRRSINRVAQSADGWIDGLDDLPFDKGLINKLKNVIQHRQKMLLLT